jgi:hypothetical protein
MRIHEGTPVEPEAAGCCVGLIGYGRSGYSSCVSEPTSSGLIVSSDTGDVAWAFACDRHVGVLTDPRPLTDDDVAELNRRITEGGRPAGPVDSIL